MKLNLSVDVDSISNKKSITEKTYLTSLNTYTILNMDNNYLEPEDIDVLQYHSVILDNNSRNILSIAPPKAIELNNETQINTFPLFASEYIEGTFIHLFYDVNIQIWEIATKRGVGCNYSFYFSPDKPKLTYREMFLEACGLSIDASIAEIPFLNELDKNHCYGFVLQHPLNHIVLNNILPKLYLVSVYEIKEKEVTFISPITIRQNVNLLYYNIHFPTEIDLNKQPIQECIQKYSSLHIPSFQIGIMFTNITNGQPYVLINHNYLNLAEIRGNHPNIQYQYLCLRRIGKVMAFLKYFPQYKDEFLKYREQCETFITNVHQSYISYYVKKEGIIISPKYFHTIYEIHHSVFIPSIANKEKMIIRRKIVKDFIEQLDPAKILYLLNYDKHLTSYVKDSSVFEHDL
jgi:hypothetical protein